MSHDTKRKNLSVVYNVTARCPWDCGFCVMDAGPGCRRPELSFAEKLRLADNVMETVGSIDLSGGEIMQNREEHLPLIRKLSDSLGRDRVGLSASGAYVDDTVAAELSPLIGHFELTMDAHPDEAYAYRPNGYHRRAAAAVSSLVKHGVSVGAQTVLTREHYQNQSLLPMLFDWLCESGVEKWSLLRFFPSGRGVNYAELELEAHENLALVDLCKDLSSKPGSPELDVHYLLPGTSKNSACRCVNKSVGILPDGTVTACFWGFGADNELADDSFNLGNAAERTLDEILASDNARKWLGYHGGCPLE